MKTNYQYIYFQQTAKTEKTTIWNCLTVSNDAFLGLIKWYAPWRQYCFLPVRDSVFSIGCLSDIQDFIKQLKEGKK